MLRTCLVFCSISFLVTNPQGVYHSLPIYKEEIASPSRWTMNPYPSSYFRTQWAPMQDPMEDSFNSSYWPRQSPATVVWMAPPLSLLNWLLASVPPSVRTRKAESWAKWESPNLGNKAISPLGPSYRSTSTPASCLANVWVSHKEARKRPEKSEGSSSRWR